MATLSAGVKSNFKVIKVIFSLCKNFKVFPGRTERPNLVRSFISLDFLSCKTRNPKSFKIFHMALLLAGSWQLSHKSPCKKRFSYSLLLLQIWWKIDYSLIHVFNNLHLQNKKISKTICFFGSIRQLILFEVKSVALLLVERHGIQNFLRRGHMLREINLGTPESRWFGICPFSPSAFLQFWAFSPEFDNFRNNRQQRRLKIGSPGSACFYLKSVF